MQRVYHRSLCLHNYNLTFLRIGHGGCNTWQFPSLGNFYRWCKSSINPLRWVPPFWDAYGVAGLVMKCGVAILNQWPVGLGAMLMASHSFETEHLGGRPLRFCTLVPWDATQLSCFFANGLSLLSERCSYSVSRNPVYGACTTPLGESCASRA